MLLEFKARIASTASARSSPATNRRVILLNDLKLFRKRLRLSLFDRYRRVDLSIAGWPVSQLVLLAGLDQHHNGRHRLCSMFDIEAGYLNSKSIIGSLRFIQCGPVT